MSSHPISGRDKLVTTPNTVLFTMVFSSFLSFSCILSKDLIETEVNWVGAFVVTGSTNVCSHDTLLEGYPKGHL